LPADQDSLAAAVTEVSEKLAVLVREEIELAKVEVVEKASSLARGAAASTRRSAVCGSDSGS
jgi:hypothetical protein